MQRVTRAAVLLLTLVYIAVPASGQNKSGEYGDVPPTVEQGREQQRFLHHPRIKIPVLIHERLRDYPNCERVVIGYLVWDRDGHTHVTEWVGNNSGEVTHWSASGKKNADGVIPPKIEVDRPDDLATHYPSSSSSIGRELISVARRDGFEIEKSYEFLWRQASAQTRGLFDPRHFWIPVSVGSSDGCSGLSRRSVPPVQDRRAPLPKPNNAQTGKGTVIPGNSVDWDTAERRRQAEATQSSGAVRAQVQPIAAPKVYNNARFGFSLTYPADLFTAMPEADNGDGRRFEAKSGAAEMAVWGSHGGAANGLDAAQLYRRASEAAEKVTYSVKRPTWFVISGHAPGGNLFYQKTIVEDGIERSLRIEYPASERAMYDPMIAKIAGSFRRSGPPL